MAPLLPFALSFHLISLALSKPVDPMVTPRAILPRNTAIEDRFVGYYTTSDNSTYITEYCPSDDVFTAIDSYFGCCPSSYYWSSASDCTSYIMTTCYGDVVFGSDESTYSCDTTCNTDYIYASNTPDGSPSVWIGCNTRTDQFMYFREFPSEVNALTITSVSFSSSNQPSTPTPTTSTTSSPTPQQAQKTETNRAWIAGVVVGSLPVVAIAGLTFVLLRIRKRNKERTKYQAAPQTAQTYPASPLATNPPSLNQGESPNLSPYQDHQCQQDTNRSTWFSSISSRKVLSTYDPMADLPALVEPRKK